MFHTPGSKNNTHKILGTLVDPLRYVKTIDTVPKKKQLLFVGASFDTMSKFKLLKLALWNQEWLQKEKERKLFFNTSSTI